MQYKSLAELKESVFFLSIEARWLKVRGEQKQQILYYYNGFGSFEITDPFGRIEKVKRGDYLDCNKNGQILLVHNVRVLYEI